MPAAADIVASRGVEGDNEEGIGFGARLAVKEERSTPLIKEEEKRGGLVYTQGSIQVYLRTTWSVRQRGNLDAVNLVQYKREGYILAPSPEGLVSLF